VATVGGAVVGCVAVCEVETSSGAGLELRRLAVASHLRRRGVGAALLRAALAFAAPTLPGAPAPSASRTLHLTSLDGRFVPAAAPACALYEKMGFVRTQSRESGGGGPNAVPMCDYELAADEDGPAARRAESAPTNASSLTTRAASAASSHCLATVHHRTVLKTLAKVRQDAHNAALEADGAVCPDWLLPSCLELYSKEIQPRASRVRSRRGVLCVSLDRAWKVVSRQPAALLLEFGVFKGGDIAVLAKAVAAKSEVSVGFKTFFRLQYLCSQLLSRALPPTDRGVPRLRLLPGTPGAVGDGTDRRRRR